jgi:hypothetical protein
MVTACQQIQTVPRRIFAILLPRVYRVSPLLRDARIFILEGCIQVTRLSSRYVSNSLIHRIDDFR